MKPADSTKKALTYGEMKKFDEGIKELLKDLGINVAFPSPKRKKVMNFEHSAKVFFT